VVGALGEGLWYANGYIDEFRITSGTAVYTANFTPPMVLIPVAQASPITVSGLTNGTPYTFTVSATNIGGTSSASTPSNSATPSAGTVPGAPTIGTATAGNASASVSFMAPSSNGGNPITNYTATSTPGGITGTTSTLDAGALLHFEGTNGSTTFTDVLGHAFVSSNGAALSTSQFKVGTASLALNGSNQSISTPSTTDFDLQGDFTIEAWVYYNAGSTPANQTLVSRDNGSGSQNKWAIGLNIVSGGDLSFFRYSTSVGQYNLNWPWSPSASTWYHLAVVRQANNWTAYVNGTSLGTVVDTNPMPLTTSPLVIGALGEGLWYADGYIDELRITGGTAVYTANFTPPSAPLNPEGQIAASGLTNGTLYNFAVTATNAVGTGLASAASNSVMPTASGGATIPGAPTIGTATAGNAQATVSFTPPSSNGGSAITGYTATSNPGGLKGTGAASPIMVTGLTSGTPYTFTVTATNAIGTGSPSGASNSVTPAAPPSAPTIGAATAGNAQATVSFTPPSSNGGSAITGYTATSTPGGKTGTGTSSPITVTRLTNMTAYTFTVTATNSVGTSSASGASNSVTPDVAPTVSISTPSNGATGSAPVTFNLTASAVPGIAGETVSVQYYANGIPIGPTLTASPYTYSWADVDEGTYSLIATATDNYGTVATSPPVSVTVKGSSTSVNVYYVYADQIDTPRVVVRPSDNQVVWRWDGADPFGAAQPNTNPVGLGVFVYNPRFPGQVYDQESATTYNYFRNYDPGIGRYVQSDPIGLGGGINSYAYAEGSPLMDADPMGLAVTGTWIRPPIFNIEHYGVNWRSTRIVAPHFSWWGYIKFVQLEAYANGYVNIDVKCTDDCNSWEVHNKVDVAASGTFEVGPNIYAFGIGALTKSPVAGLGANVALGGAAALQAEYQVLQLVNQKAGPIISAAMAYGPTAICLGSVVFP
jgi:RHS repeat-associated protein